MKGLSEYSKTQCPSPNRVQMGDFKKSAKNVSSTNKIFSHDIVFLGPRLRMAPHTSHATEIAVTCRSRATQSTVFYTMWRVNYFNFRRRWYLLSCHCRRLLVTVGGHENVICSRHMRERAMSNLANDHTLFCDSHEYYILFAEPATNWLSAMLPWPGKRRVTRIRT